MSNIQPTSEDLRRNLREDLELCNEHASNGDPGFTLDFAAEAVRGWPSALRRAIEAEAQLGLDSVNGGPKPCGDNSCVCELRRAAEGCEGQRGGMRTNGGCRCGSRALRLEVMRLRKEKAALRDELDTYIYDVHCEYKINCECDACKRYRKANY